MSTRPVRPLLCLIAASAALGIVAAPVATGEAIRTDTTLGGFSISANAAPIKILVDDPSNPLPRPEDGAIVEANPAYTQADLATGPAGRGIASSLWPGNLLGEGIPTASNNQLDQYPVKAESRYPDKPYTATGSLDLRGNHIASDQGALMTSSALGLDVAATAKFNPTDVPGAAEIGGLFSHSTATVTAANVAIGHSISKVSDVALLGGLIRVGSVSTVIDTTSDGKKPTSSGTTVVSGLVVGTTGFVVDDKGARPVGLPIPGSGPLPSGQLDPLKQAGITIDGIAQTSSKDAESASRSARGLRITIDTTIFRNALNTLTPGPVTSALYTLFNQLPQSCPGGIPVPVGCGVQGFAYYSLSATPKLTYILGGGESTTSAILPITFDFGPPVDLGNNGPGLGTGGQTGAVGGSVAPPALPDGTVTPNLPESTGPTVASTDPVLASGRSFPKSPPVTALLVLGALLVAGLGGWGMTWLRGFAFGAGLLGAGCALGAPSNIPSLHAEPPAQDGV